MYADSPSIPADEKREGNHCKQRWRKINDQVSKFCGAYAAAHSPPKSGKKDYVKLAHEIFFSDYNTKFMLEHAWNELKSEQKCCVFSSVVKDVHGSSSKRRKFDGGSTQSTSSQSVNNVQDDSDQSVEVRPPGVKATKDKMKKTVSKTATDLEQAKKLERIQTVWDIKQKAAMIKRELMDKKHA